MPENYQQPFKIHLQEHKVSTSQFQKDIEDIQGRLRQQSFTTTRGVRVTVPAENSQIVEVKPDQIIVNDELLKVDRR